ncbi:MAG: hypothetical protein L6R42_007017 [Xanthoria sp. 1 TBL-2021]|nr:MAG: hypothetical protein L6R42_007017 [Xanthoria sp. 1 TBL-2021]
MPKPHREASPAMESDIEGNADGQDSPGPGETSQQRELHERDEQNTSDMSNIENEPIDFHESPDVCWKLSKLYGFQYSLGHRYEMLKFVANLHDLTINEVDPSVSALEEAFQFRYMSINSTGVSPVTENFRGEAHRILDLMYDAFDANTQHFLRSMKESRMLHAMCKVFSVDMIRATDARQSSIRILKDMKYWTEQFDLESQCRACVNARWRRFSAVTYRDWGGTEYMEALYGYPQIEDIETLRSWHDTYERHQTKASILLCDVYQRYRSFWYPSLKARPESNFLANYELPAFIAGPTVIYKMDEVRAISDSYSIQSSEDPFLQEVRLLGIIEKQSVRHKPFNINTILGEPGVTVYWTPNGIAVSAMNLMLHHQDVDQSLNFGQIGTRCKMIAIEILKAFVGLEQGPPGAANAVLVLHWGVPLSIRFFETAKLRSGWADLPAIKIHRFPNNTTA